MRIFDFGGGRDRCRGFDMLFWRGASGADVGIWGRDDDRFDERFDRELDVLGLGVSCHLLCCMRSMKESQEVGQYLPTVRLQEW